MENHNTHLGPGFTLKDLVSAPANVAVFWGLLGPGGFNSLYQMTFLQWNHFSPCGLRTSRTPLCSWGFALPTRAPPGMELQSCSLSLPLFTVLMEFKPSPFSLFSLVPVSVSNFPLSLQLLLGRGAFPIISPSPDPQSQSSLCLQKRLPARPIAGFSLPKFTSLCHVPAELCGSGCADCCVDPPISLLGDRKSVV